MTAGKINDTINMTLWSYIALAQRKSLGCRHRKWKSGYALGIFVFRFVYRDVLFQS